MAEVLCCRLNADAVYPAVQVPWVVHALSGLDAGVRFGDDSKPNVNENLAGTGIVTFQETWQILHGRIHNHQFAVDEAVSVPNGSAV